MSNPYVSLMRTAWRFAGREKKRYICIYTLFIFASIITALHPLLYGWFIDGIQQKGINKMTYAWWYVGIFILLKLGEWAFHGPARVMERKLAFNISLNYLQDLYHQTLHLPVKWHQDHHSGATINRIRKAHEALKNFFQNGFMYLYTITKFLSSFIAMIWFSPIFGTISVVIGALTVYLIFLFDKPFMKAENEKNEKEHIVSSTLFDSLSNIITVITLRLEKRMEGSLLQKVMEVYPPFRRSSKINEWKWFGASMLVSLIYVITTVGYIYQHTRPGAVFMLGSLVALLSFVNQFTSVFHNIASQYTQIVQYNTDIQTARFITGAYQEHHLPDAGTGLPADWQTISIEGLNFSHKAAYSRAQKAHSLHDIDIVLEKGKRVAFIGESGSGKSTLMAVLRGLYEPAPGARICIDGIAEKDMARLSESITLFPQEPEIFENTIEHNITLGLPFKRTDIIEVCDTAHFADVVRHLPKGLQSSIKEKGVNLSGGQKQRLALARGILAARSSEIVLLDEPTSSIDPRTEIQIYKKLFKACEGKALASTLHRLYLLPYFDYIYILQDGYIADEGTFDHLKKHSILFNEMWKHQEKEQVVE
jgi:ATP-binding cassette, subfamily B, bacterial